MFFKFLKSYKIKENNYDAVGSHYLTGLKHNLNCLNISQKD